MDFFARESPPIPRWFAVKLFYRLRELFYRLREEKLCTIFGIAAVPHYV
jgi:hypothetical protein